MKNLIENIRSYIPFEDKELQIIESLFKTVKVRNGECILAEGQICKNIYYVNSGCFKACYINDGKENVLDFFLEDHWFVELGSFINESPTSFFIEAIEDSDLYSLSKEKFEELIEIIIGNIFIGDY